jgi:hypothetical protein
MRFLTFVAEGEQGTSSRARRLAADVRVAAYFE